jgi:hypothetical protein
MILTLFIILVLIVVAFWVQFYKLRGYFKKHYPQEYTKSPYASLLFGRYDYTWDLDTYIKNHQSFSKDSYLLRQMKVLVWIRITSIVVLVALIGTAIFYKG